MKYLKPYDKEIADAIYKETNRQHSKLQLIASENYISEAVLTAQGCIMTNKYAEGYPAKRYYQGCGFVDIAEHLAIERVKKLFKADHANVQPHSGSQANMAVYLSILELGDTILGMNTSHGGHLTHGKQVSSSGKMYNAFFYTVKKDTGIIDYDEVEELAHKHKPKMIIAGASAYPRIIDFSRFSKIAKKINAYLMVDMAHIGGLIAADEHPDPVPYADFITSSTHKTLRGPRGGLILCKEKYKDAVNKAVFPGIQGGPLMHAIAAKAVAFKEALEPEFRSYQKQIIKNAKILSDELMKKGYDLVSNGTDNHLMLIDLNNKNITGNDAAVAMEKAGIIANKNMIPYDEKPPLITSGVRIGTPSVTTRGMKEEEMKLIADYIDDAVSNLNNEGHLKEIAQKAFQLCEKFPLYKERREEYLNA